MLLDIQHPPFLFVISCCWLFGSACSSSAFLYSSIRHPKVMVSFHGQHTRVTTRAARLTMGNGHHVSPESRPPDPKTLLDAAALGERVQTLMDWWQGKENVFCITGAGLSTDSGIPDYRGNNGSYHRGHKPIIHQQFMDSDYQRKRYWGRSMVGWSKFDSAQPNKGHFALAKLESMGHLGVTLEDQPDFYEPEDAEEFHFSSGQQDLAVVTQNVDPLHQRAGSKNVIQLHGGGTLVRCMNCGKKRDRKDFHREMEARNGDWVQQARDGYADDSSDMRPDGDAVVKAAMDYNHVHVPNCPHCKIGFYKPDVVFFGDSVPKHRLAMCREAVEAADGILVVGSSLAVHSAFRHIRAASLKGTPVAILNVGETRAEAEGLDGILKIEAPAGDTLSALVEQFSGRDLALPTAAAEL